MIFQKGVFGRRKYQNCVKPDLECNYGFYNTIMFAICQILNFYAEMMQITEKSTKKYYSYRIKNIMEIICNK